MVAHDYKEFDPSEDKFGNHGTYVKFFCSKDCKYFRQTSLEADGAPRDDDDETKGNEESEDYDDDDDDEEEDDDDEESEDE
jgi:hypothetical protein